MVTFRHGHIGTQWNGLTTADIVDTRSQSVSMRAQ